MDKQIHMNDRTFTKIFVGGLPYSSTDQSLRDFFSQFGEMDEAVVIKDRNTGKSKGYGFVTMSNRAGAQRACLEPNPIIDGRKTNVNLAYLGAKERMNQTTDLATVPCALIPASLAHGQYVLPQYVYPRTLQLTSQAPGTMSLDRHSGLQNSTSFLAAESAMTAGITGYPVGYPGGVLNGLDSYRHMYLNQMSYVLQTPYNLTEPVSQLNCTYQHPYQEEETHL